MWRSRRAERDRENVLWSFGPLLSSQEKGRQQRKEEMYREEEWEMRNNGSR